MQIVIQGIYRGEIGAFSQDGHPTAIFKRPVTGRVRVHAEGIEGDHQADRRVHGGVDKAVHHFVADHFPRIAERFPAAAGLLVAGSIGENFSSTGLDESGVCIGDVWAVGSTRLQVSQPRSPCWKMDARYGTSGLSRFVSEHALNGWYYRVLAEGETGPGDEARLIERNADAVSVAAFWRAWQSRTPDRERLARLAALPGLAAVFQRYLRNRVAWLDAHPREPAPVIPVFHPRPD